jgi:hypothetical protein
MQRLLGALGRKAAEQLVAQDPLDDATTTAPSLGVVDGLGLFRARPLHSPLSSSKPVADQLTSNRHRQWRHQGNTCR